MKTSIIRLVLICLIFSSQILNGQTPTFSLKFGTSGTGDGELSYPCGIAISASGEIYVVDRNNERVQVFNSSGVYQRQFGSLGSGNGQFGSNCAEDIAFDSDGNFWVTDRNQDRVEKFNSSDTYVSQLGTTSTPSSSDGEFDTPNGVAISSSGEIYIADRNNERVQVFNSSGVYQRKWGSSGSGDGQFASNSGCEDIAIDSDGNVWVTDRNNHRIQKFTNTGTYLMKLGTGTNGSSDGQFAYPEGVAIHPTTGNIYIADRNNDRIQVFNSSGTFLHKFGSTGTGDGQFNDPVDMTFDNDGNLWVVDRTNHRVQKFTVPDFTSSTWTGTDTWNESDNWSNGLPGSSTNAIISSGTVTVSENSTIDDLTISSGAVMSVNSSTSLTVSGSITNNAGATGLVLDSDASNTASLIVTDASTGNITVERYITGDAGGGEWHLTGVPVVGQGINDLVTTSGNSISTNGTKYGLGIYNEGSDTWTTYTTTTAPGAGNLTTGVGYESNRSADGDISFIGTLSVSQVDVSITRNGNGWNLLGNPYPCALYANDPAHSTNNFIDINAAVIDDSFEALYFWNASTSQYDIINNASSATYIPNGQAFFVKSVSGGGTASFTTAMRVHQTGATFKTTVNNPQIIIKADNGEEIKSTEFRFINGTTMGLDPGYDAGMFNGNTSGFQFYSRLMQDNGVAFALQCLPTENYESNKISLEFYATGNEIEFSAAVSDLPDNIRVYLEDRLNNTYSQLGGENNTYLINVDVGTVKDRFYLHTTSQALDQPDVWDDEQYKIVPNPQNSSLSIEGNPENVDRIEIIDVSGRMVYQAELNKASEIKLPAIANGVYVVKLIGDKVIYSQKINWIN